MVETLGGILTKNSLKGYALERDQHGTRLFLYFHARKVEVEPPFITEEMRAARMAFVDHVHNETGIEDKGRLVHGIIQLEYAMNAHDRVARFMRGNKDAASGLAISTSNASLVNRWHYWEKHPVFPPDTVLYERDGFIVPTFVVIETTRGTGEGKSKAEEFLSGVVGLLKKKSGLVDAGSREELAQHAHADVSGNRPLS